MKFEAKSLLKEKKNSKLTCTFDVSSEAKGLLHALVVNIPPDEGAVIASHHNVIHFEKFLIVATQSPTLNFSLT